MITLPMITGEDRTPCHASHTGKQRRTCELLCKWPIWAVSHMCDARLTEIKAMC